MIVDAVSLTTRYADISSARGARHARAPPHHLAGRMRYGYIEAR